MSSNAERQDSLEAIAVVGMIRAIMARDMEQADDETDDETLDGLIAELEHVPEDEAEALPASEEQLE